MNVSLFTPVDADRINDPLVTEKQRCFLTAVSRAHAFQLERQGQFPKHIKLDGKANGWRLSEILTWVRTRPVVTLGQGAHHNDVNEH